MTDSRTLAQLLGPSLMAITLSEASNLEIWRVNLAAVTYLNGTLLFIAGLSILRVHHHWPRDWRMVVTLTACLSLLAGLYRMFLPQAPQGGKNPATYTLIAILFAAGAFLTIQGYRPKQN